MHSFCHLCSRSPSFSFNYWLLDDKSSQISGRIVVIWGIFAMSLLIASLLINAPLKNASTPYGIVSYELASSYSRSNEIMSSWDAKTTRIALFGLGFDFLFLVSYSMALGLWNLYSIQQWRQQKSTSTHNRIQASSSSRQTRAVYQLVSAEESSVNGHGYLMEPSHSYAEPSSQSSIFLSIWSLIAYGQWVAAISDCGENISLLQQLLAAETDQYWAHLAAVFATIKFSLIIIGIVTPIVLSLLRKLRCC